MDMSIKTTVRQTERWLNDVEKRQVPFATANAINDTLFDVKRHIGTDTFPRSFPNRKNKSFAKRFPFMVNKASKRRLYGFIYDVAGFDWLSRQESGGIKLPKGNMLAIPQKGRGRPRRTARGYKPSPREMIANKKQYFSGVPNGMGEDKAGIWKRMGKGGRAKLLLMYAYEHRATVQAAFPFYRDAILVTNKTFEANFYRQMGRAMRTARK